VVAVAPAPTYSGNRDAIWKEAAATARIVFGEAA
jgi:hypothetical protein